MQNRNTSDTIQILTPSGYKPFDGVARWWHDTVVSVSFDNGCTRVCAPDHRFIVEGKEIFAKDIKPNHIVGTAKVLETSEPYRDPQWLYDPTNVSDGEIYVHDGDLVSHNTFTGSSNTLVNSSALLILKAVNPIQKANDVRIYDRPVKGHKYVLTADTAKGRGQDYSTVSVIDVSSTPFKQVATYRNNLVSPMVFPDMIYQMAKYYNDAYVIIESNDQGSMVYKTVYYEYEYENVYTGTVKSGHTMGLEMNKKVKRIGCSNLKDLIEQGKLEIVDKNTIDELTTFEAVRDSYEARDGCHDDLVMTLVHFAWFVNTNMFGHISDQNLRQLMTDEKEKLIHESVPLFGEIVTGSEREGIEFLVEVESELGNHRYGIDDVFGKEFGAVSMDEDNSRDYLF